jgi:lipid-A-disaccharide synthase-like uncharacterized protein
MSDWLSGLSTAEAVWIGIGLLGQGCFFFRLLIQWIVSERRGQSVVPVLYWYLSLAGGVILFCYAVYRRDPVFILGQSMGCFVYVRNLVLIRRGKQLSRSVETDS